MSRLIILPLVLLFIFPLLTHAQLSWDVVPVDITIECNDNGQSDTDIQDYIATITASSACDPGGEVVINDYINPGNFDCGDFFTITFDATDNGCSTPLSATISVDIDDTTPPVVDQPASDLILTCDPANNQTDILDWINNAGGATYADECSATANITLTNDYPGIPPECSAMELVTFTIEDECGNETSFGADIIIDDFDAPAFMTNPPDITLDCNDPNNATLVSDWLTDIQNNSNVQDVNDCTDPMDLIVSNNYDGTLPPCLSMEDVDFTVEDDCGNVGPMVTATIHMELNNTFVSFSSSSSNTVESNTIVSVCLQILNESPTVATDVEVTINGSSTVTNGTDIVFINPVQNFQFPAGSMADICFNVEILDDNDIESNEDLIFDITNVSGGDNAMAGSVPTHTFTIIDEDDNDGDGIANALDNCPDTSNPGQEDLDGDGIGNVCDNNHQVPQIVEFEDNLYMSQAQTGVVLKAPNGSCFILVVNNDGTFQSVPVDCP